eukprot:scaffold439_cov415-Prasinococcus_capsulatus_cf.AAC.17
MIFPWRSIASTVARAGAGWAGPRTRTDARTRRGLPVDQSPAPAWWEREEDDETIPDTMLSAPHPSLPQKGAWRLAPARFDGLQLHVHVFYPPIRCAYSFAGARSPPEQASERASERSIRLAGVSRGRLSRVRQRVPRQRPLAREAVAAECGNVGGGREREGWMGGTPAATGRVECRSGTDRGWRGGTDVAAPKVIRWRPRAVEPRPARDKSRARGYKSGGGAPVASTSRGCDGCTSLGPRGGSLLP